MGRTSDATEPLFQAGEELTPPETIDCEPARGRRPVSATVWGGVVFGLLVLVGAGVAANRVRRDSGARAEDSPEPADRSVRVIRPAALQDATLTLPANIEGFQAPSLCARVNGYVRQWHADIGDRVKRGQVLAEIDTPELDQEIEEARAKLTQGQADIETAKAELREAECILKQAVADVARAKANLDYSRGVLKRNATLNREHAVAQQDVDDSQRDSIAKQADVESAEAQHRTRESNLATRAATIKSREAAVASLAATVRRLEETQAFKKIVAPFDGVVIRRRAEVGMLVGTGSSQASQELFGMAQVDRLRIKINVPQTYAASIELGRPAKVLSPDHPDRVFAAKVARTSRAIDPAARTLAVELELDNPDTALLPGAFGQVVLTTRRATPTSTIPIHALLSRTDGPQVAVVDPQSIVRFRKIRLGRDYGRTVEVLSGLRGDESVVVNPPDDLKDNEKVSVAEPTAPRDGGSMASVR
jgi:RND family efflux transporter MFP subunit